MTILKQFHSFFPFFLVIIFIENSIYYILKIMYGHFVSETAKIDKSYWHFSEFHWNSSSSSVTECECFWHCICFLFLLYSSFDVSRWNLRRTKRHRQFSHWKGKVLPNIWTLITNGKDFLLDERKRQLKVKLM